MSTHRVVIGLISYNDKQYLKNTLPLLAKLPSSHIIILDNASNDDIKAFIKKSFPSITYIRHPEGNVGFSKGHNYILKKAPASKYYLCLNTDIKLEKEAYEQCVKALEEDSNIAMVSGKLYHWDSRNDVKTTIIDTLGIIGSCGHHFWDRGQGKKDVGQYDDTLNTIFGISGAAFFIRRSIIHKLHGADHLLFDEHIFMYKDDVDLAYRMRWQQLKITLLPVVLGYHARTLGKKKKKSLFEAKNSYKNHWIMLRSNFDRGFRLRTKLAIIMYELLKFLYYLVRKPKVLSVLPKVWCMKVSKSKRTISPRRMEQYFLS